MTSGDWRSAAVAVTGTSHRERDAPCQDAFDIRTIAAPGGDHVLAAVLADGASSASLGQRGAHLAVLAVTDGIEAHIAGGGGAADVDLGTVQSWLARLHELIEAGLPDGGSRRDYACTLLAAVVDGDAATYVQIGDGAIIFSACPESADLEWAFWPQRGEYENQTHFATDDDALDRLELRQQPPPYRLALLSDGLQRLALHYATQGVHTPFFRPLFARLEAAAGDEFDAVGHDLARFLDSPRVNARTDDDKTLILAVRPIAAPIAQPEAAADDQPDREATG